jgi:uncharacterized membrane protein YqjE
MSETERRDGGNGARPGFVARLDRLISALTELLATRSQILGRELSEKGLRLARGSAAAAVAAILAFLTFLLFAALVAAIFARLFGSAWAGILAALVLYAAGAAAAAMLAVREFGRVRPLDFPMTSRELGRDWEAVRRAAGVEGKPAVSEPPPAVSAPAPAAEDFEERLRRGLE